MYEEIYTYFAQEVSETIIHMYNADGLMRVRPSITGYCAHKRGVCGRIMSKKQEFVAYIEYISLYTIHIRVHNSSKC